MADARLKRDLHEENRLSWNEATRAHNSHKGDQARFLREGGSTLFPEEVELLGPLRGSSLLHLQCNSGQDTLSLARLGATVTGVDISDEAVAVARRLSEESRIPGEFHRADIYDWLAEAARGAPRFDVVFSSYGAVYWLSDLAGWASGIASVLRPAGRFVLVEFHPTMWIFDEDLRHAYPYSTSGEPISEAQGVNDYVAASAAGLSPWHYEEGVKDFKNPHRCHSFPWGLGDMVTALLDAGLAIEALKEYPYSNGCKPFRTMRMEPGRRFYPPEGVPSLPMMFGVVARKRG
jgi:SAM-dependent methyltransferase